MVTDVKSPTPVVRDARPRLLVVGSEAQGRYRERLEAAELHVDECDPERGRAVLRSGCFDVVLVSRALGVAELSSLAREVKRHGRAPLVLAAESFATELVALALRLGADAIFAHDWDARMLRRIASWSRGTEREGEDVAFPSPPIGPSEAMREAWRLTVLAAERDASAVITGETGCGKEMVARALHRFSPRRRAPFVAINCAAVPETLLESELFGHERGAFTGAETQRIGTFERAAGGTLFLDEIGDMPMALQAKLLRVLQERTFQRIGGAKTLAVEARVVAATNRPLRDEVSRGRFRADLFYRLCSLAVHVPPLRERRADALALWEHLLSEHSGEGGSPPETSAAVKRWLIQYDWPGNIRELENVVRHITTVAANRSIRLSDLPDWVGCYGNATWDSKRQPYGLAGLSMKDVERAAILETYDAFETIRATAEALNISPRKVQYRIKDYRQQGYLPDKARAAPGQPERGERALRVLLVEDDDELRGALADLLESEGYEVVSAQDGSAAVEHLGVALLLEQSDAPIDVIVVDVRMPGLNGLQILEGVRTRGWQVPVVVMSAFGDETARAQAESLGATAFLEKPLDTAALQRIMRGAMH